MSKKITAYKRLTRAQLCNLRYNELIAHAAAAWDAGVQDADLALVLDRFAKSATNPYATDGKCHEERKEIYYRECWAPAEWLGVHRSGLVFGYCTECKEHGEDAAKNVIYWHRIEK